MSGKKLQSLCVDSGLINGKTQLLVSIPLDALGSNVAALGKYSYLSICGAEVFKNSNVAKMRPEDPPAMPITCLPGTNRRPLKAWQLCSREERQLEIALACSLDVIMRIAIDHRISIPDPEDAVLLPGQFPTRELRWTAFMQWYAGEEDLNPIPGKAVPTVQRVVFAEEWEMAAVRKDPYVVTELHERGYEVPEQYLNEDGNNSTRLLESVLESAPPVESADNAKADDTSDFPSRNATANTSAARSAIASAGTVNCNNNVNINSTRTSGTLNFSSLHREDDYSGYYGPLITLYSETVGRISGYPIRFELMRRHLATIIGCRRLSVMRWMWPPGAARTGRQFIFTPGLGIITPPYSLPLKRIKPFPSRRRDAYTLIEMEQWLSVGLMDKYGNPILSNGNAINIANPFNAKLANKVSLINDDLMMNAAEKHGFKRRAYHDWLSKEKTRQSDGRVIMAQEDFDAHVWREMTKVVEDRLKSHADRLKYKVARARELLEPDKAVFDFNFSQTLPAEYWYIFEESREFKYGCGIKNEDELEELQEIERERAQRAVQDALQFENYLHEEIHRREMEELARLRREEQDRRLAEVSDIGPMTDQ